MIGIYKMKLAIFTDTFLPQVNGVTNTLRRLGEYLESKHIDYIFVTPEQKCEEIIPYNMECFLSTSLFLYPECRITFPNLIRLNKRLDQFKPNVIFCMTEFQIGLCGVNYGKKHGIPVISNYSTNFTTILKSYKLGAFEKILEKYLKWFHNKAGLTVTPSVESEKVLNKMGVDNTGIFSRGIDFHLFSPEERSSQLRKQLGLEGKIALLYVGRLSPEKDLDLLCDTMHQLNIRHKDKIHLVITGDGPMKQELEKNMPSNVTFTGYKTGAELAEIYASCDIFAFPSGFETFGNVVLEAFASGLPVVGVNEGGVKVLVEEGSNGYLAKPRDLESFSMYLEEIIENEPLRNFLGQNAREAAKSRSWEAVFEQLLNRFNAIIEAKSSIVQKKSLISNRQTIA